MNGFLISTAKTFNQLILDDRGSQIFADGAVIMNTSANMIRLRRGSMWKSSNVPVNSGSGTVIQKGTSAAGAFAFDTTYNVVAADEMCLNIQV